MGTTSVSASTTSVRNDSITFGEGVKDVKYYAEGATVQGLGDEAVAALSSGYRDVAAAALEKQGETASSGYKTIEKIVGNLQAGTETALSGIEQAYAKSTSGTAALDALKPFLVGGLALAAIAILSSAMKR